MPFGSGWWAGTTDEYMNIAGPLPTRAEAIAAGRAEQGGEAFWIVLADLHTWYPPSAESIMDLLADNSDEMFFDDGFPGFDGTKEAQQAAKDDLNQIMKAWLYRHMEILPTPTAFSSMANLEKIDSPAETAADLARDARRDDRELHGEGV